jgi:hypothetical protein
VEEAVVVVRDEDGQLVEKDRIESTFLPATTGGGLIGLLLGISADRSECSSAGGWTHGRLGVGPGRQDETQVVGRVPTLGAGAACALALRSNGCTPGSSRPANNSSIAVPPAETWFTRSSSPKRRTAATVSPPATTVAADVEAIASAIVRVPTANCGSSKRPIGPLQNTVPAAAMRSVYRAAVFAPMSSPI